MDPAQTELLTAAAVQVLIAIATVATLKADLRNLTGWVHGLATDLKETRDMATATKATLETHMSAREPHKLRP